MHLLRWGLLGAAAYGVFRYIRPFLNGRTRRTSDGLSALFETREQAELAVEHLVQEYGVDRAFIYVDPVGDENSAGSAVSGGDHASGRPGSHDRNDGSHYGAIELTVPIAQNGSILRRVLREAGARRIEAF